MKTAIVKRFLPDYERYEYFAICHSENYDEITDCIMSYKLYSPEDAITVCMTEHVLEAFANAIESFIVDENMEIVKIPNSPLARIDISTFDDKGILEKLNICVGRMPLPYVAAVMVKIIDQIKDISPKEDYRYTYSLEALERYADGKMKSDELEIYIGHSYRCYNNSQYPEELAAYVLHCVICLIYGLLVDLDRFKSAMMKILHFYSGHNNDKIARIDQIINNSVPFGKALLYSLKSGRYK